MSLQQQRWCHTVVDVVREPVCDRERTGRASRSKKENGERCLHFLRLSRSTARDVRPERMVRAEGEKETGKENASWTVKGEQGGANEWTTGLTAAECTAGVLLPSSGIEPSTDTAVDQPPSSENGLHATVGAEWKSGTKREVFMRACEREPTRRRWRLSRPWIKHLSTVVRDVSGTGLYPAATRREVHRSPRLRYRAGFVCRARKSILFG